MVLARSRSNDRTWLATRFERGQLTPQIGRRFALRQIAEAHAVVETKRARGRVMIVMSAAKDAPAGV